MNPSSPTPIHLDTLADGGPAFPSVLYKHYPVENSASDGMSLRDWFAGKALAGLLANPCGPIQANSMSGWQFVNCDASSVSAFCYAQADAMLKARTLSEVGGRHG